MRPPHAIAPVLLTALLALAGCQSSGGDASPETAATERPAPAEEATVAFEPITGVPDERAGALAAELASVAIDRGIDVVPREDIAATFRVKGYFTATSTAGRTAVTYVWDVFSASGARAHRIAGTESVEAVLPDPWQAVTDDTLMAIGRKTSEQLAEWLEAQEAQAAADEDEDTEEPLETGAIGSGVAGFVETREADPLTNSRPPRQRRPGLPRAPNFTYYIDRVSGATADGAVALPVALAAELDAVGGARVARPADADFLISGEAAVNPAHDGRHDVALIWLVRPRDGEPLGTVRQISRVAENQLAESWGVSADHAAAAAAPGVLTLMLAQ